MIGCMCPVCTSSDPRNLRTRTSTLVECRGNSILIDTTPELRLQCIANGIRRVDAILFTHAHADHIFGLDDIRRFNEMQQETICCYGSADTIRTIKQAFEYIFVPTQEGGGKPRIELTEVSGPFDAAGAPVVPVPVFHGRLPILGYRIGGLGYVTDCSRLPESSKDLLHGLDVLVLGVLRHRPHETHLNLDQGIALARELSPKQTYFVHLSHGLDHETTNHALPPGIELAYDGLRVELGDRS